MKAAVVHAFDKPLIIEDVPKPKPGPDEIMVKIEAAGLCHTDIHAAHGDWPVKPKPLKKIYTNVLMKHISYRDVSRTAMLTIGIPESHR